MICWRSKNLRFEGLNSNSKIHLVRNFTNGRLYLLQFIYSFLYLAFIGPAGATSHASTTCLVDTLASRLYTLHKTYLLNFLHNIDQISADCVLIR